MQILSRREAIRRAGLTAVGVKFATVGSAFGLAEFYMFGCPNAQQWFQIVGALLPIVGQTYLQFYGFAKGGVDAGDIAKVQTLTQEGQDIIAKVGGFVQTFQTTKSAGIIAEINALLTQAQQDVDGFLTDAQIKNSARFAQFKAFADAILADIKDIVAIVPVVVPLTSKTAYGSPTIVEKTPLTKAKTFEGVFKDRLASLPK